MTRFDYYDVLLIGAGGIAVLLMALFSVSFIFYYHRRQREASREKLLMRQTFQRELLQSQLETQNHTLLQIAEELHDNIGQLLTVALMRLNTLQEDLAQPEAWQNVEQVREVIHTIITDVRAMAKTLDYNTVERFGLLPSLTLELERIERMGHVSTQLITAGEPYALSNEASIVLLRMVQESLNNALKHARARQLTVTLNYRSDVFICTITDDGQGFDLTEANTRNAEQSGSGLDNLQRRAGMLGGNCQIESQPGEGTRVIIQIPR